MSLEVRVLDAIEEVGRNQWNHVVEGADLSCVYHRYGWLRAVEDGTEYEPNHVVVFKKNNPIGILPNFITDLGPIPRLSSLRPGFGGPAILSDEEKVLKLLLEAIPDLCTGRILYNELRTYDLGYVRYHKLLKNRGYESVIRQCRFVLDLTSGWDEVFSRMDSERRRGIRRGNDQACTITEESLDGKALSTFYDRYVQVMERTDSRILSRTFFDALADFDDRVRLWSVATDGKNRGKYLYLLDREQSTLQHLFTAVTQDDFDYHAAELLHEHAIRWGIDHGFESYELRGAPADFRNGVFRFKELFGATAVPILVWERGRPRPALPAINLGRAAYRRFQS